MLLATTEHFRLLYYSQSSKTEDTKYTMETVQNSENFRGISARI